MKLRSNQRGFTVVELVIVVVFIGVLGTLVVKNFVSVRQKDRDNQRELSIKAIHRQLEAYYAQDLRYPSLANLNDPAWRTSNIKSLDPDLLKDPQDNTGGTLTSTAGLGHYAYIVLPVGCTNASDGSNDCKSYKTIATYEGGGTFEKDSLN